MAEFELTGNHAYNVDCMELMAQVPDKFFDLAVVDPPYGGGCSQNVQAERERERELHGGGADFETRKRSRFGGWFDRYHISSADRRDMGEEIPAGTNEAGNIRHWDIAPPKKYFDELARVSKNQIIWGGNYFSLPPTRCFLVWRKLSISESFSMAMAEYAWTSFNGNAKVFEFAPQGNKEKRFHPTQKPIELYRWIFQRYAKRGDKILDTHLGSGGSRIAAHEAHLDFIGCELDPVYFRKEEERFAAYTAQMSLF